MNFEDTMATNPPRLVIKWRTTPQGEQFEWGIIGNMPAISLLGAARKAQHALCGGEWIPECPEQALVVAYDAGANAFQHYCGPEAPADALVGMLDVVALSLASGRVAQREAGPMILGPDGRPVR